MALPSKLTIWCYPYGASALSAAIAYSRELTNLKFTTNAVGGMGVLTATLHVPNPQLPHPELAKFARIALVGRGRQIWYGEISDTTNVGNKTGELISIKALGAGASLRDDPLQVAYSAQTGLQIVTDQLSKRAAYNLPVSQDVSAVFPDAPATTVSPTYEARNMEDVLGDVTTLMATTANNYVWGVWSPEVAPTNTAYLDSAKFALGQVQTHLRDVATTHFQALIRTSEVTDWSIADTSERAYNYIEIRYNDVLGAGPGAATSIDPRLDPGTGAITTAPFRRRKYSRDYSGVSTVTAAIAQNISDMLLAQMKNASPKVQLTIKAARDGTGNSVPLYFLRADKNYFVADLATRGKAIAASATPGVTQFYAVTTTYTEDAKGAAVVVEGDNYFDNTLALLARLQLLADKQARSGRTYGQIWALGQPYKGWVQGSAVATAGGQSFTLQGSSFPDPLARAPTSITFDTPAFATNATGPNFNTLGIYGFNCWMTSVAGGACSIGATFHTNGNCVYDIDEQAGTFTHHCSGYIPAYPGATHGTPCDRTRTGLSLKTDVLVDTSRGHGAHEASMSVRCPNCGAVEGFNCNLGTDDEETAGHEHRATQARTIRAMMRHPHVGLHQSVRDCRCEDCTPKEKPKRTRKPRSAQARTTPEAASAVHRDGG